MLTQLKTAFQEGTSIVSKLNFDITCQLAQYCKLSDHSIMDNTELLALKDMRTYINMVFNSRYSIFYYSLIHTLQQPSSSRQIPFQTSKHLPNT